ncbi:MAG: ketoacyl-ACP synthase III [Flavobacteriales bacterium]|nr:ketoacyl-ACP synthase III [Flavobacteriales bacterium]
MASLSFEHCIIKGISTVVPRQIEMNASLEGFTEEEKRAIIQTTGIEKRRIAPAHITSSDLGVCAAKHLMESIGWEKSDIEILVFVTQTPDYLIPANSMHIQHRLGLSENTLCLDINQGCAAFVYGLSVMYGMMTSGKLNKGILITSDTITHTIHPKDKSLRPIFADAGSAIAIEYNHSVKSPSYFELKVDGSRFDKIILRNGGFRNFVIKNGNENISIPHQNEIASCLYMNGQDIFHFGLREIAPQIQELMNKHAIDSDSINYWIFHQANKLLNDTIARKLQIPENKLLYSLQEYGNTSCATIPVTLSNNYELINGKELKTIVSGFGVGLSWGTAYLELNNINCQPIITYED